VSIDRSSRFLQAAESGEPLRDVLIIDAHTHLLGGGGNYTPWQDADGMLMAMDQIGIDRACSSALRALNGDLIGGNNAMLELVTKHPDRFVGFVVYNPRLPDVSEAELERCFREPGVRGIKVHPASYVHDYPLDGPNYEPVWEFARRRGCPVLTHAGPRSELHRCGPDLIDRVATRHPQVDLLIGHSGSYDSMDALESHIQVVVRHDHLFLDISAMGRFYRAVDYMVQRVGSARVVFGSDGPFHSFSAEVGHVVYARMTDADKENVLGLNMEALLGPRN
jgi:predicted TIM-barrel fold metal-dependent hydrolase